MSQVLQNNYYFYGICKTYKYHINMYKDKKQLGEKKIPLIFEESCKLIFIILNLNNEIYTFLHYAFLDKYIIRKLKVNLISRNFTKI